MNPWYLLLQIVPIFALVYFYVKQKYSYWSKLGVKGPKPSLAKLGNVTETFGHKDPFHNEIGLVQKYGKVYGIYSALSPVLTIADNDLVKQIMVKDFHKFTDRRKLNTYHYMINDTQVFAKGDDWKRLRSISSPSFTSGKLRKMQGMIDYCINNLLKYLDKQIATGNGVIDTKKVIGGFAIDSICSTLFATETNANENPNDPVLKNALQLPKVSTFQALSAGLMPLWINNLIGVEHFVDDSSLKFFEKYIAELINHKKRGNGRKRNDLAQMLIEAYATDSDLKGGYDKLTANMDQDETINSDSSAESSKQRNHKLTDKEIIAQSLMYFMAGFDTTSSAITEVIFELSHQPDLQDRLRQELNDALGDLDPTCDEYYDIVMKMDYLEAVVKEALRKYPPLIRLERRCMEDGYKIESVPLQKDQLVEVSTYAIHYNPEYWPDPFKYDPERFMPENRHLIQPYTFIPFGEGPRNCVGLRMAYQQIYFCLSKLIREFRFAPTPNTPAALTFQTQNFATSLKTFEIRVSKC